MPKFGTNYEIKTNPDAMSWEAVYDDGAKIVIQPHLCSVHEHSSVIDHRDLIDVFLFEVMPPFGLVFPTHFSVTLELASTLIEGLSQAGEWAFLNRELGS